MDSDGGRSSEFLNHYSFLHESSMVDFNSIQRMSQAGMRRLRSEAEKEEEFSAGDDDDDAGFLFRPPGKKRRLSPEQVKYLEKSFGVENKLEPERKILIAKELGLQPRQVAIWFQNRRARFKTKQLERDYDVLKSDFESLKADYDSLLQEKNRLQDQASALKTILNLPEGGTSESLNLLPAPEKSAEALLPCKQEEVSSAKSDVFDSESPHCTEGNYSSAVGPEQSDLSPEEDLRGSFLPVAEEAVLDGDARGGAGLPDLEEQPLYWPWFY